MADLWSLTIAFRNINTSIKLVYSNEKDARSGYAALVRSKGEKDDEDRGLISPIFSDHIVEIVDSFGSTLTVNRGDVMAHWVTDLGAEAEAMVCAQVLQAHAQSKLQRRLASDPMLKGVSMMQPPPPGFKLNG